MFRTEDPQPPRQFRTTKKTSLGVSTEHSLRQTSVDRYRKTHEWLIGVFRGHEIIEVWQVDSRRLEPFYQMWEAKLEKVGVLNNPKIPLRFIQQVGLPHLITGPSVNQVQPVCPHCHGAKFLTTQGPDLGTLAVSRISPCPECQGYGYLPASPLEDNCQVHSQKING
jgi:hypothetical protein